MAFYIAGKTSLDELTEADFRRAADEIGLGQKVAMNVYHDLCDKFQNALEESAYALTEMGFSRAGEIKDKILRTGGIERAGGDAGYY